MLPDRTAGKRDSRILWGELADRAMTNLEQAGTRPVLLDAVRRALAMLDDDPERAELRRIRFQNGLWAVAITGDGHDWVLLWERSSDDANEVVIWFLGPSPGSID